MSISASLANLRREGQTVPRNPPNLKLTQLAETSSLSERAASARNALTLLSTADPTLPTFEQDIYLSESSFDRTTLSPDAQQALSSAITRLTLRLTPVFLTRPCTALLEWLLQTLQLPTLGSTDEIDACMLCALPFHHTEQFLAVSRTLLRSPNANKWRWLVKKVKTGRLVDTQFCVDKAPLQIFKHIILRAVECVKEGVVVTPLAALVTNFVGRRMASDDRPVLAILCIDALVGLRDATKAAEHLLCALFVALAAAVSHGLELQVVQTIASASAQFLSRSNNSSAAVSTSVSLLALCLRRHPKCLSSKDARMLLKVGKLPEALKCLAPVQSVDMYSDIIECAITSGTPSERLLRFVEKAMKEEQLLSVQSVSKLVQALLDACAKETGDDSEKFAEQRTALLASLLTTLFKGSFSETVDDALQRHFVTRKAEKRKKKTFQIIDAAVSKALDEILSRKKKDEMADAADWSYPLAVDILCLSHPEKEKRKNALESITARELVAEHKNEKELRRLVVRLKGLIESERDLHLVATALENVIRIPSHIVSSSGVIRATLMRCCSEGLKEHSPERDKMAISLLGLCEKISDDQSMIAPAILLLLSCEGLLERCCQDDDGKERITRLLGRFGTGDGSEREGAGADSSSLVNDVIEGIGQMILNETDHFSNLFSTVADINEKWIGELSGLWLKRLWARLSQANSPEELGVVSQRILGLAKLHPKVAEQLICTFEEDVESVLGPSDSPRPQSAVFVWTIVSELINGKYQQKVLTHLIDVHGLSHTIEILKNACFDLTRSNDARKRSLEWYINFCVVHPDVEIGKEAVVTVSRIAYGDNSNMRSALDEIWSRRSVLNRKKRERKCILWDFLQLLSTLPERPAVIDPVDTSAKLLYTEMQDISRDPTFQGGAVRAPLRDASFGTPHRKTFENHLASNLLCKKQLQPEDLYLLRALGRSSFADRDDQVKLYSLLESTLRQFNPSDYSGFTIESIYRLAMLIVSSGKPSDLKVGFRSLAKAVASTFQAVSASASEPADPTLATALLCLMGFIVSFPGPRRCPEKDYLIDLLLAHGILSTTTGACARRITSSLTGGSITCDRLLQHLKNLVLAREPKSKQSLQGVINTGSDEAGLSTKAALGAVRAIHQFVDRKIDGPEKIDLSWLQSSLHELWKLIKAVNDDDEDILTTAETHDPEQVTAVLKTAATLHRAISKKHVAKGRDAAMTADFDALISVAFAQEAIDGIADPAMQEVRNAAHTLVEVLITSQDSGARHVLPKLLQSQTFAGHVSLITKLLERVVPTMTCRGNDLQEITEVVADAAYNDSSELPQEARKKIMRTLVTGRSPTVGAFGITKACLREIYKREHCISSPLAAAKECSSFLQDAHLACDEDIDCIILMEDDIDCRITGVHFVNPEFLAKLGSFGGGENAEKVSSINRGLSRLFVVLLGLSPSDEKEQAICLLLASIPLSGLQLCIRTALESELLSIRIEALRYLGERIRAETLPLFPTWGSISDESAISANMRREIEAGFLDVVGNKICEVIKMDGTSPDQIEIREVGADTLRCLAQRLGSSSFAVVQEFASRISELSAEDSSVIRSLADYPGRALILRGKILECLASFTSTVTKYSLPFVPYLLESSCSILEKFCDPEQTLLPQPREKNYDASVFVTAASIKALTAILTSCPMFFGGKSLKRLVLLVLRTEVEAPRELLREVAAREVPVAVFVSVFGNFAAVDDEYLRKAPVHGLLGLVESVSSGVGRMYKSEIKVNWQKILNVLLRSMDCGRDMSILCQEEEEIEKESQSDAAAERVVSKPAPRKSSELNETRFEKCHLLDSACADVLVKMVLKLSESEFEGVFKALVQWFDGGSIPDSAVTAYEDHGAEIEKNLPRALSFFVMTGKLLSVLKNIMIPYFVQLITRLTTVIGREIPKDDASRPDSSEKEESRGKKRSRAAVEGDVLWSTLVSQQCYLRETCMKLVASFFSLEFKESMMNTRLVGELQEALLSAFDDLDGQSETVSKALQGLAKRMVLPGITSDTKKNQDLLIGLVRGVLSRTRDESAKVRCGALMTCRDMAMAVGDEFLATLPESMPMLAEVIDDEEGAVAKAAERYVLLLESMAGEPILQQLK